MKKLVSLAVSLLMAALFCFFTAALAQEPTVAPSPAGTVKKEPAAPVPDQPGYKYKRVRVLKGGNLALIAEKCGHRQTDWPALYAVNPQLPKVENVGDMRRVWVQPDQMLNLPVGWEYGTLDPEYVEPYPPAPEEDAKTSLPPEEPRKVVDTAPATGGGSWNMPDWLLGLLIILVVVLVILWLAGVFRNLPPIILSRWRDPSRYPAMVNGGLSVDLDTAVRQLGIAYPGRRYERIERCRLIRDDGVSRIRVRRMAFGDGVSREAYLNPGDEVYRGTLPGGGFDYFLRSCGNIGPEFELPAGWRVAVLQSQDVARPTPPVTPVPPTPPVPPVPPAPVFPAEPESVPVPAPELAPAPEPEPTTATAPAESSALEPALEPEPSVAVTDSEETKSPRKVKVTVGDLSIEVVGNGEVPATKIELEDGVIVILQQQ